MMPCYAECMLMFTMAKKKSAFARELAKRRRSLRMTQKAFADKLGVPLGTLISWENDQRKPSASAMALLRSHFPENS